jgi:hypothetical protein
VDLEEVAAFLEAEASAFEVGLYALPTVSGSRLPDALLPFVDGTFDGSSNHGGSGGGGGERGGSGSGGERGGSGSGRERVGSSGDAADEGDCEVEVLAPPSVAAAIALAPAAAPEIIYISD